MLEIPVADLLGRIADERPTPGGGSVAALAVAMAAALVEMVMRSAPEWEERGGAVAQACALRARVTPLALLDADAYEAVLDVFERPAEKEKSGRDAELARKLGRAAEVPLRVAEAAADVAELAFLAAERGDPRRRPDAVSAALLAEAAARVAAHLVSINLASVPGDDRVARAAAAAGAAAAAAERAAESVD